MGRTLQTRISRRSVLQGAVALGVAAVVGGCVGDDKPAAQSPDGEAGPPEGPGPTTASTSTTPTGGTELQPTPACDEGDDPTPAQGEGPFFTPDSPERASLLDGAGSGTRLVLTGTVVSTSCQAVKRALLDFWQADGQGQYDTSGFRLRGHLYTDADGRYRLETLVPGLYPGRTRHLHVRVQPPGGSVLTTQLYFPDEPANTRDGIYRRELVMQVAGGSEAKEARFTFVVPA